MLLSAENKRLNRHVLKASRAQVESKLHFKNIYPAIITFSESSNKGLYTNLIFIHTLRINISWYLINVEQMVKNRNNIAGMGERTLLKTIGAGIHINFIYIHTLCIKLSRYLIYVQWMARNI